MVRSAAGTNVIFCLETQEWQKMVDEELSPNDQNTDHLTSLEPIVWLGEKFRVPLEAAGVDIEKLSEEFYEMVLHATQFISLSTMG